MSFKELFGRDPFVRKGVVLDDQMAIQVRATRPEVAVNMLTVVLFKQAINEVECVRHLPAHEIVDNLEDHLNDPSITEMILLRGEEASTALSLRAVRRASQFLGANPDYHDFFNFLPGVDSDMNEFYRAFLNELDRKLTIGTRVVYVTRALAIVWSDGGVIR